MDYYHFSGNKPYYLILTLQIFNCWMYYTYSTQNYFIEAHTNITSADYPE